MVQSRFIPPRHVLEPLKNHHPASEPDQLSVPERLKLARGILDRTCTENGAGYVLLMFIPGTDMVLRSFRGLDTPEECAAAVQEVATLLGQHAGQLKAQATNGAKPLHNDS